MFRFTLLNNIKIILAYFSRQNSQMLISTLNSVTNFKFYVASFLRSTFDFFCLCLLCCTLEKKQLRQFISLMSAWNRKKKWNAKLSSFHPSSARLSSVQFTYLFTTCSGWGTISRHTPSSSTSPHPHGWRWQRHVWGCWTRTPPWARKKELVCSAGWGETENLGKCI